MQEHCLSKGLQGWRQLSKKTQVPPESSAIECCWEIPRLLECSRGQRPRGLPFKAELEGLEAADSKAKGLKYRKGSIGSHKEQCESVSGAGIGSSSRE